MFRDGLSGVPDAQGNNSRGHFGMFFKVGIATTANFGKELNANYSSSMVK